MGDTGDTGIGPSQLQQKQVLASQRQAGYRPGQAPAVQHAAGQPYAVPAYAQPYRPGNNPSGYPTGAGLRPVNPPVAAPKATGRQPKLSGRRRALLVGINYVGTRAQLRGCINDVRNMRSLLTQTFGWDPNTIRTLTDDGRGHSAPTRANIQESLRWLAEGARPGDTLFFHFSGHGAQQEDPHGYEEDGMNETILPVDFKNSGMITDDQIS